MKARQLCEKLGWSLLCGDGEREVAGCYIGDLLSRVMGNCSESDVWITVQTSRNMIAVAVLADVAAVLLPEGIRVTEEIVGWAAEEGITLLGCSETAFEASCGLARTLGIL